MGWWFWRNKNKSAKEEIFESLEEKASEIVKKTSEVEGYLPRFDDKLEGINQQLENNESAIQKSMRLEYKSSQEILMKLNQLNEKIDKTTDYSERYIEFEHEKDNLIKEKDFILQRIIQWLDDIDLICDKIDGQGHEYWIRLLEEWQKQIIKTLEILGVYEIDIMGKTFNHEIAESISTKKKGTDKDYLPYEVVDVLQRGFILEDGTLLRKAKVVTIEEERTENYEQ
mgnify:CR=1 FL=1